MVKLLDLAQLETFILEKMRESKTPGLSIVIVKDGKVEYAKGFGFRNISAGLLSTPRTLYGIASVTKSFTALAIMQLAEQGKLKLDDPVEKHVPTFPRVFGESPTIHNLLSHSSGLPNLGSSDAFIFGSLGFDDNWFPITTAEEMVNFVKDAGNWAVVKPHQGTATASGGLISNVLDLSKYLRMCIDGGCHERGELIGSNMFEAMESPHIPLSWRVYGTESYGYGWWTIPNFFGCKLVEHTGWLTVSSAFLGYVREKKIGVAVLGNPCGRSEQIGQFAIAQLIGGDPQTLPAVREDRILRRLEGDYETYRGTVRFKVKREGDLLIAEFKNKYLEEKTPLIPETLEENRATFTYFSGGAKLTSEFNVRDDKVEWVFDPYKLVRKT